MIKNMTICFFLLFFASDVLSMENDKTIGEINSEMLIQFENTSGLPNGREELERTRLFIWSELEAPLNDNFSFGISFYGNLGTDDEENNRRNLDNSASNTAEFDQYYLDWNYSDDGFVRLGKQLMHHHLSSMIWDKDISLIGATVNHEWLDSEDNQYLITVGRHNVDHIFSEQVKISFANLKFSTQFSDNFVTAGLTLMQVTDTEFLIQDNVRRTNTEEALREGFDIALVDLSFDLTLFGQAVSTGIEVSENFALDAANKAYRVNLILGNNAVEGGWQYNLHYQDIERNASVAAFADDDWWFATWMTGYRASMSYGVTENTFVQISYFNEKLLANNTKRVFVELRSFF